MVLFVSCSPKKPMQVMKGHADISEVQFSDNNTYILKGEWEFYWHQLIPAEKFLKNSVNETYKYIHFPKLWNKFDWFGKKLPAWGYATYHIKLKTRGDGTLYALKIPYTYMAHSVWVDDTLVASAGVVGTSKKESLSRHVPVIGYFIDDKTEHHITMHISSFSYMKGGTYGAIEIGTIPTITYKKSVDWFIGVFLFGSLVIMGIHHITLFIFRRKERAYLFFGIFCTMIALRSIVIGEIIFSQLISNFPIEILMKVNYLAIFSGGSLFMLFFRELFPQYMNSRITKLLILPGIISSLVVLVTTSNIFGKLLYHYYYIIFLIFIYLIRGLICAARNGAKDAMALLAATMIFTLITANDILYNTQVISSIELTSLGVLIFILVHSFVLSNRFTSTLSKVEKLSLTFSRFVPRQFLTLLNRNSITDVTLGDAIQKDMTILFADIRQFTSISEKMTPRESFLFINDFFGLMGPVIREYGGFVDKYIGDGIMALFPGSPESALRAAIRMRHVLAKYNKAHPEKPSINIGIGIHTGKIMLGTIGEQERMESTVISDDVNLASRMEGLTKKYGAPLVISGSVFYSLKNVREFSFRHLDVIKVKGKNIPVVVIEILNGYHEDTYELKLKTKKDFQDGISFFLDRRIDEAEVCFKKVLSVNSLDSAAQVYLKRINYFRSHQVLKEWDMFNLYQDLEE